MNFAIVAIFLSVSITRKKKIFTIKRSYEKKNHIFPNLDLVNAEGSLFITYKTYIEHKRSRER